MDTALNLTGYDFAIIGLLLLFTARGLWVGFLRQITTLVALFVGFVIAGQYHDKLFPFLRGLTENPHAVFWASYAIIFAITYVVTMLFGKGLAKVVELTIAGWFDKLLGGALGIVKAGILVVLLNMLLSGVLAPENKMLRDCQLCPLVEQATEFCRGLIKDDTLRKLLSQKKSAISAAKEPERGADGVRPFVSTEFPEGSSPSVPVK